MGLKLEIVCEGAPGRLNEDAWIAQQAGPLGSALVIAAIDGATTRLAPPPLTRYLDTLPEPLTPAAYAARLVRDALAGQIAHGVSLTAPETLLLEANAALGRALTAILGGLTLEHMQFSADLYETLKHDPRLARLGLPASVATLAVIDPAAGVLRWAHAGDSLLLVAHMDGRAEVPTATGEQAGDEGLMQALNAARAAQPERSIAELARSAEVRQFNLHSGLRHNYVDERGDPALARGIGVLDGLPELRHYVRTGAQALDGVAWVCAMTDGLEWPAGADEVFCADAREAADRRAARIAQMAQAISADGLRGYLRRLRAVEAADVDHTRYPRMKTHDDATGVLVRFSASDGREGAR